MLIDDLNPAQREAAAHINGPLLILAGAGSGKTRTITYRIAHMISVMGIDPHHILGVTFTNKAATEMRERVASLISKKQRKNLTLCTFHSLGIKILKEEIHHLGYKKKFAIFDQSDQISLIRETLRSFHGEKKDLDRKIILAKISFLKNKNISPEDFMHSSYFDPTNAYDDATNYVYTRYQKRLLFYNAIDFDDILFMTAKIFSLHPEVAEKYSKKYQYIMVDEYQDTNDLQFKIISYLTCSHQNICAVGDDDQGIYAFRGANITNILEFEKTFHFAKIVKLEQNYRSTNHILNLANEVIKHNKHRKEKTMWSHNHSGDLPLLWLCQDDDHEGALIADDINALQNKGVALSEVAILFRSARQIPALEDHMRMGQIPYTVIGGQKFYEKKEIKDLIAYLCVIDNPENELSLRRIINTPPRGIGLTTLKHLLEEEKKINRPLYHVLLNYKEEDRRYLQLKKITELISYFQHYFQNNSLSSSLRHLIEKIHYLNYIDESYDAPKLAEFKKNDVENFILSCERFEKNFSDPTLENYLEKILLADSFDQNSAEGEKVNQVTLMTLHASKGLEFDYVFMPGFEEEILPHKKTIVQGDDISEERRLCYVGITRARKRLVMSRCKERKIYNKMVPRHPSRFLNKLSDLYNEQDRTTYGDMNEEEIESYKNDFFANLRNMID